ncbi:hypothetical protein [Streptomyces kaempferi]|uniref:DoxX family protein n=1 Tax=Streptomyces kaempferi TaxID=333725 RepID=A0ABW3XDI6_9ACTN
MKRTVKRFLEALGVVALVRGALGLVHGATGRLRGWGPVERLGVLDGYESCTSVALVVLAGAPFAAAGSRGSG